MTIDIIDNNNTQVVEVSPLDYTKHVKMVYPKVEEELVDFLNRCKLKDSEVILCSRCNVVFDKEVVKGLEKFIHKSQEGLIRKIAPLSTREVFSIECLRVEIMYHL